MVQLSSDAFAFGGDLMPVDEALGLVAAGLRRSIRSSGSALSMPTAAIWSRA